MPKNFFIFFLKTLDKVCPLWSNNYRKKEVNTMLEYKGKLKGQLNKDEERWVKCVTRNAMIRKLFPDEKIDALLLETRQANEELRKRELTEEQKLGAYIYEVAGTCE